MLRPNAHNTLRALNLALVDKMKLDTATGMPMVGACAVVPERMIPFNKARKKENCECGVHFFIEDYSFSNLWQQPERYAGILARFDCVLSPDFSTYFDMPAPMVRWQIYRRRFLSRWLQSKGIDTIYSVQTLQTEYDDDQLSGIEPGGVIAMKLPLNVCRNSNGRNEFYRVLCEVEKRLSPKIMLIYGKKLSLPTFMNYKFYENDNIRVRRAFAERKRGILA